MKRLSSFFKSNWAYILFFFIYGLISILVIGSFTKNIWGSILYTTIIYSISITIALSPVGESLLRIIEGANPIYTQEDKDYLLPIFEEVYEEAKTQIPTLNNKIQLFISESMSINAFAVGRKTIAVTRGAIYGLNTEELKGVLAHEFGHMAHGDTKALLIHIIGNGIFSIIISVIQLCRRIIEFILAIFNSDNVAATSMWLICWIMGIIIDLYIIIFINIGNIIISLNNRQSEYYADEFAYSIGYGEELKNALYALAKISLSGKVSLKERLLSSHPHIRARIQRLEGYLEADNQP